jgi:hypothetical protein
VRADEAGPSRQKDVRAFHGRIVAERSYMSKGVPSRTRWVMPPASTRTVNVAGK